MPDSPAPNVVDGVAEPSRDELHLAVLEAHVNWLQLVDRAGLHALEPGASGDWNVRDVQAHINAYHRFLVTELGGTARPFEDMPAGTDDVQKRNEVLHAQDIDLPPSFVFNEFSEVHEELIRLIESWSEEELRQQMVPWNPWPRWRWIVNLTLQHYDEHIPDFTAWLESLPKE